MWDSSSQTECGRIPKILSLESLQILKLGIHGQNKIVAQIQVWAFNFLLKLGNHRRSQIVAKFQVSLCLEWLQFLKLGFHRRSQVDCDRIPSLSLQVLFKFGFIVASRMWQNSKFVPWITSDFSNLESIDTNRLWHDSKFEPSIFFNFKLGNPSSQTERNVRTCDWIFLPALLKSKSPQFRIFFSASSKTTCTRGQLISSNVGHGHTRNCNRSQPQHELHFQKFLCESFWDCGSKHVVRRWLF